MSRPRQILSGVGGPVGNSDWTKNVAAATMIVPLVDMKAKTELLLYRLLWLAEKPMRPTFCNIEQSFEGWAYRAGLLKQVARLEARGLLESRIDEKTGKRLHRLTAAGRLAASGGRDPEVLWSTKWDGKWRLFLFDIPETQRSARRKLTRTLASSGCGCLQGSVWIAPRVPPAIECHVAEQDPDCSQVLILLADSKGDSIDARMVETAWDFEKINELYREALAITQRFDQMVNGGTRGELDQWTVDEKEAWRVALGADPLLPAELLPKGYSGRKAWRLRRTILAKAARMSGRLQPERGPAA
jgi:phenylacetic acid degradation operon negative regulatory protein